MMTYESKEELHFSWYLDELLDYNYIKQWKYQPKPFPLADQVSFTWQKQLKTKQKEVVTTILREHKYQADFLIIWHPRAVGRFVEFMESGRNLYKLPFIARFKSGIISSVVDVKGNYNQNDAWRRFSIEQKWVWQRYHVLVQKIIPKKLFPATFTPKRYIITDKGKQRRRIKYEPVRTLEQFIAE